MNKKFDLNFNAIILVNLLIGLFGLLWGWWNADQSSFIYTTLALIAITALSLIKIFKDKDPEYGGMSKWVKAPFTTNLGVASYLYLLGWIVPIILQLIIGSLTSFSITSFSIPLSAGGKGIPLTFDAASISNSTSWDLFKTVFVAGNWETFIFSFVAIIVGVAIGLAIWGFFNTKNLMGLKKKSFVTIFAILFSGGFFVFLHTLNNTYTAGNFLFAAIFILLSNISIYYGGIFLTFWAGYHQSNNFVFMVQDKGIGAISQSLFSFVGVITIAYMLLIAYYVISNWDEIQNKIKKIKWLS